MGINPKKQNLKIEIMRNMGTTYQPKHTQGGKPSVTGMLYLKRGSEEII